MGVQQQLDFAYRVVRLCVHRVPVLGIYSNINLSDN